MLSTELRAHVCIVYMDNMDGGDVIVVGGYCFDVGLCHVADMCCLCGFGGVTVRIAPDVFVICMVL